VSFVGHGRHDVKVGGEYIDARKWIFICARCLGILDAQGGAAPANLASLFPDPRKRGNLETRTTDATCPDVHAGDRYLRREDAPTRGAAWIQDDWSMTRRLVMNLGLRYDIANGVFSEEIALPPFLRPGRPIDRNNLELVSGLRTL